MWIFFPDQNSKVGSDASSQNAETPILNTSWTGSITPPSASGETWNFEVIRHTDVRNRNNKQPFSNHKTVVGLLDYQTPCTLIYPTVLNTIPSFRGTYYKYHRTILKGTFQALITNIPVDNVDENQFTSLEINSLSFLSWHGTPIILQEEDHETKTACLKSIGSTKYEFDIASIGIATCTTLNHSSVTNISGEISSSATLLLKFTNALDIRTLIQKCAELDRLFCVLIGHRTKQPAFNVFIHKADINDDIEHEHRGELNIGGVHWTKHEYQPSGKCLHHNGLGGGTIDVILKNYFLKHDSISQRVAVIEYCRFISKSLIDKLNALLPTFEQCLKEKYSNPEELSFIDAQQDFFNWVESAPSDSIKEFTKKHIAITNKKSPSFKTLIERAIADINRYGFDIDASMSGRISTRRGKLFHSFLKIDEGDINNLFYEYKIAITILNHLTFIDLGIDIRCLGKKLLE